MAEGSLDIEFFESYTKILHFIIERKYAQIIEVDLKKE